MPELPEVECIVRDLKRCLIGKKITGLEFMFLHMLRGANPGEFSREICGRFIEDIRRKGKYILFFLSGEKILEVHLRMTGSLLFYSSSTTPDMYTGAIFYLEKGAELHFHDIRKFGTFKLYHQKDFPASKPYFLGPDPLSDAFNMDFFLSRLEKNPQRKIKAFLLDQRNIAGMGNIYTDEALFRAGLHPGRKVAGLNLEEKKRLYHAVINTLQEGIAYRGTSFSDYRDLWGQRGNFQERLNVYRREKEPCPKCASSIQRSCIAGRGSYFCPCCQPEVE